MKVIGFREFAFEIEARNTMRQHERQPLLWTRRHFRTAAVWQLHIRWNVWQAVNFFGLNEKPACYFVDVIIKRY